MVIRRSNPIDDEEDSQLTMRKAELNRRQDSESEAKRDARKPYTRPQIISREKLEALAVTCDPAAGGKGVFGVGTCLSKANS